MIIEWMDTDPLKDLESVYAYEKEYDFIFPDSFKEVIMEYNGGRPINDVCFDSSLRTGVAFWYVLPFNYNKEDLGTNMWDDLLADSQYKDKLIVFAIDNIENMICFYRDDKSIVFLNHKQDKIEFVATSFSNFLGILRVSEV